MIEALCEPSAGNSLFVKIVELISASHIDQALQTVFDLRVPERRLKTLGLRLGGSLGYLGLGHGMLHVGVADYSDLHCSLTIFTWLSLQLNVTTCISE